MTALTTIFIIGAVALSFLMGMILELALDDKAIRELQHDNNRLRLEIEQLQNNKAKPEIIEINDNRANAPVQNYFRPF